ncbi:MAG: hypothetical protein EPN94_02545 [Nitrospirae bacterium]|nr:MAG: hypothetical protein EPN94_02545 [Nitrospirota bacterium]
MTRGGYLKIALFIFIGILTGLAFAGFRAGDYRHASIVIKKGEAAKPLYVGSYRGRQVIALSAKNLQSAKDIEIKMDGAVVQSWYPPVIKMPYSKWMNVEGGRFGGVDFGKRLPLYLIADNRKGCGEIEIVDLSDGSLIQRVHVMSGGSDDRHH